MSRTQVPVLTKIEEVDEGVYLTATTKQATPACKIMEDTDATTMCIAIYKGAIWLYTN